MNIYDTKSVVCSSCGQIIGEIDFDAEIIRPKCGQCANPTPHIKDKMPYPSLEDYLLINSQKYTQMIN